jgi:TolB-like protein/Tfp pilus assembly protein PilF
MKRCPQCNRVETDEALKFCRADGATLVIQSATLNSEAGTAQLGSPSGGADIETSILPNATDANFNRATGPTTVLPVQQAPGRTNKLSKPNPRIAVIALAILLLVGITIVGYFFLTKSGRAIDSVAVLPFQNVSGDKETEFLSDGISETLINNFTRIPTLRVTARSTAFRYRGKEIEPQQIGRELNVGAILSGKVLQRGDSLSIQVDLINVTDGSQIWGNSYNGKASEILDLQQRIARDVSERLRWKLSGAQEQQIAKNYTQNPEAYQLYLKGRFYWNRRTAENLKKAIEQFRAAADKDQQYALAYVGLADCYLLLEEYAGMPVSETLPQATAFATRALEIDESLAEAHVSMGLIHDHLWQWAEAERELKRAIALNPNYPTAHHWYSIYLRDMGRFDDALAEIQRAQQLDPLSMIIGLNEALTHFMKGDTNTAIDHTKKAMELDPLFPGTHLFLGRMYLKQGHYDEALAEIEKDTGLKQSLTLRFQGYALGMSGKRNDAVAIARELESRYAAHEALGQDIALVYVGLGEKDKAFDWLERDFKARSGVLQFVRSFPEFESLRSDARYADLLRRMNLPE